MRRALWRGIDAVSRSFWTCLGLISSHSAALTAEKIAITEQMGRSELRTMHRNSLQRLPHSLEAERAVLGAILLDGNNPHNAIRVALEHASSGDFFIDFHRTIVQRMVAMAEAKQPIDLVTLVEELESRGELEAAGGSAYIAALPDGLPRVSNVQHYAKIVREKAIRRMFAHAGQRLSEIALMPHVSLEDICAQARELTNITPSRQMRGLKAVTADTFLSMELPAREMMLDPILATQSLTLLYSKRGVGKTFVGVGIAHTIATGGTLFGWSAPKQRGVLLIDGELPARVLRDRISVVAQCARSEASLERLRLITPDLQGTPMPDLATREGQALVESHLDGMELLILDNLSALCRSGKENESEGWLPVQEWALRLRQRGVAILFVHHAGKAGAQRGTSRREDVLDLVLALRHPTDYSSTEGLRCELHFEKCRSLIGEGAKPFEVRLQADSTGALVWTTRPIDDALLSRAAELFKDGVSVRDAAEELQISRSKAHRLKAKLKRTSDLE